MVRRTLALVAPALVLMAALGAPILAQDPTLAPPKATPLASPPDTPAGDGTGVRLTTEKGDIVIGLFNQSAPVASENFLNLVKAGFYAGLTFHRLVPGFVIQGGDPNGDGSGGPGYVIPDEPVVGRYGRGIVAMARTSQPDSAGSQFFIVLDDGAEPILADPGTYVIFGRVVEGMDVVDAIAAMPNSGDPDNTALQPVKILTASVEQVTLPPEPSPPISGAPELEAVLPTQVNGEPMSIQSNNGAELRSFIDPEDPFLGRLEAVLATLGATLDEDLAIAGGTVGSQDAGVNITAIQVKGADGAAVQASLLPLLLGLAEQQESVQTIGGKSVSVITDGPDSPEAYHFYAYASGDIVFLVQGTEPYLTDAILQLP